MCGKTHFDNRENYVRKTVAKSLIQMSTGHTKNRPGMQIHNTKDIGRDQLQLV